MLLFYFEASLIERIIGPYTFLQKINHQLLEFFIKLKNVFILLRNLLMLFFEFIDILLILVL
jgi:hypothetical protein